MTITVCNGKGGAGKTTLAVLLAIAFKKAGFTVALLDEDPQGTATQWLTETGDVPLARAGEEYPHLIIDTPPQIKSPRLHQALGRSDAAILVSSPSPADLWTSKDTVTTIKRHLPPGRPARLLFNQVQHRTVLARNLDTMAERIGLPALGTRIGRRQTFQHAALLGWTALDATSREELLKAALEIAALRG